MGKINECLIVGLFGFLAIGMSDSAQEFAKHSNMSNSYSIVVPRSVQQAFVKQAIAGQLGAVLC